MMKLHFIFWSFLVFAAVRAWTLASRFLFTQVWPNAAAATALGV
jgi:hypothetical protein